jgi:hypothetical protein
MITKTYEKTGRSCRVTFQIPAGKAEARHAVVLGEWNGWNPEATPMKRDHDGSWTATTTLETGRPYRFRYLLDGAHWLNDDAPDALLPNQFGSEDSVLALDAEVSAAAPAAPRAKKAVAAKTAKPAAAPKPKKAPAKAVAAPVSAKPTAKGGAKAKAPVQAAPKPAEEIAPATRAVKAPKAEKPARRGEAKEK